MSKTEKVVVLTLNLLDGQKVVRRIVDDWDVKDIAQVLMYRNAEDPDTMHFVRLAILASWSIGDKPIDRRSVIEVARG